MRISKAVRSATKQTLISTAKTALASIPVLGTMINEVLFELSNRIKSERLELFIDILSEKISSLEEKKIDKEYLESEDFYDMTLSVVQASIQTQLQEKHQALANIYITGIENRISWNEDLTNSLIKITNELTPKHIIILKFMVLNMDTFRYIQEYDLIYEHFKKHSDNSIGRDIFRMCLSDFEKLSLMYFGKEIKDYADTTTTSMNSFGVDKLYGSGAGRILLTEIGLEYIKYLAD